VAEATRALLRFTDKLLEPHEAGSFRATVATLLLIGVVHSFVQRRSLRFARYRRVSVGTFHSHSVIDAI
jgi:hypothetical protein